MGKGLVSLLGLLVMVPAAAAQPREADPAVTYSVPIAGAPVKGPAAAHVTLVVASEYDCPFCKRLLPTLEQLQKDYPRELRIVHKNFIVHPQTATAPAHAGCAAHQQGKFWEFDAEMWKAYDTYRATRDPKVFRRPALIQTARNLGLDIRKFERDMDRKCQKIVSRDHDEMAKVGIRGVPGSFVNGRHVRGAQPIETFKSLIDEELRKARRRTRNNKRRARRYYDKWIVGRGVKEAPVKTFRPRTGNRPPPPPRRPPRRRPDPNAVYAVPLGNSPARGPAHAKVTMVVACQFSGPFCKKIRPMFDRLQQKYGNDLKLVTKHFVVHRNRATEPALAACAAHQQGKYWEMDARLYGKVYDDRDWSRARMRQEAQAIGLDMQQFDADITGTCQGEIAAEESEVRRVGASGTPTTYINGRYVSGARPERDFAAVIDEELRKANKRLRRRGDVKKYYTKWVMTLGIQQFRP